MQRLHDSPARVDAPQVVQRAVGALHDRRLSLVQLPRRLVHVEQRSGWRHLGEGLLLGLARCVPGVAGLPRGRPSGRTHRRHGRAGRGGGGRRGVAQLRLPPTGLGHLDGHRWWGEVPRERLQRHQRLGGRLLLCAVVVVVLRAARAERGDRLGAEARDGVHDHAVRLLEPPRHAREADRPRERPVGRRVLILVVPPQEARAHHLDDGRAFGIQQHPMGPRHRACGALPHPCRWRLVHA
mmetsp:Transcript_4656/g.16051  ORF Transcript_4656/g.16051 Transcript_4656/m.16051 type:complete len:239 (-) Transcript_4656:1358-2074(-)